MVAPHYDTNAILIRPIPSRSQHHLQKAFQSIFETLCEAGYKPTSIRLDNEAPKSLKKYLKNNI